MITILEANTKQLLLDYIKFPFSLYKNNPYWVPPLINDELETFDKSVNPAFENADANFFLAYKNNEIVGRVCAIINWDEVNKQNKSKIRFGWFDFIDDIQVSTALLKKVSEIGKQKNLNYMEGPMGFSNLDKVGVLTEGFDEIGSMITWYNFPYYAEHLKKLGFIKEKEYLENKFPFANVKKEHFEKANNLVRKRYELKSITFKKTKNIMPYVDEMFELFNASYANLSSFVAITNSQKEYFKKKYINFINPEYIIFVQDKNSKLIGFSIVMPSFAKALQKAKGKLFPLGFYHLLNAKKNSKEVLFYLIGIAPEYQNKGVHAVIFDEYFKAFTNKKIINCIRTPELSDNHAIHNIWKHFDPEIFKKRCTYRIDL